MNHTDIPETSSSVIAQVAQLSNMPVKEIKVLWQDLFKSEPPTHRRIFLERRLAYRLQENALKPSHKKIIEKNQAHIQAIIKSQESSKQEKNAQPIPGTVLTRIYQDVEYQISVTYDNQFEFEGRLYRSLSAIAREITGTQWSGPLFFGLRKSTKKKTQKRAQR